VGGLAEEGQESVGDEEGGEDVDCYFEGRQWSVVGLEGEGME
jgi:hypothetical protein